MRPEILNPLFGETQSLTGVGKALTKPLAKLGLTRVKDLLYHAPSYWMHRKHVETLNSEDVGETIVVKITPADYRSGGPRSPFRVHAVDGQGNAISLTFFGRNTGWPRKLLPLNEEKVVTGKLEQYGDELQILHPDVVAPSEVGDIAAVEPVYPLSEGLGNKRMCQLIAQAIGLAPELPEWIESSLLETRQWQGWRQAVAALHSAENVDPSISDRLAYDEVFANQLAFMLIRASNRRNKGVPIWGDVHLRSQIQL
ncbi:MAG: ATP-dependent DNA helicase RecG, partial [Pseudomonadota bacterium]